MKNYSIHIRTLQGFTLVELMITLTILTLVLLMAASLGRSWIDRSQVTNGMVSFQTAVQQAQALALRNSQNQPFNQAAVSVCWNADQSLLQIIRAAQNSTQVCKSTAPNQVLQNITLSKDLAIKYGTQPFQCISFNSAGVLVLIAGSGCVNETKSTFKVGKNNETADFNLI